jgi:hypothetical protein
MRTGCMVGAVLAVLAGGVGLRRITARPRLIAAIGMFGFAVAGVFTVLGLLLSVLCADATPMFSVIGLPWTVVFLLLPLAWVTVSARLCLSARSASGARSARTTGSLS